MVSATTLTSGATDWPQFYKDLLGQIAIPATSAADADYGSTQVVVRDLVVQLDDVYSTIRAKGLQPRVVSVYADVVRLSTNPLIADSALVIAARRIEADPGVNVLIDFRTSTLGRLIVFAQEFGGALPVKAVPPSGAAPQTFELSSAQQVGTLISLENGVPTSRPLPRMDDTSLQFGSPARLLLGSQFQLAAILFATNPDMARSLLEWQTALTRGSAAAQDNYLQAAALLAQLNSYLSNVTYVPYLDRSVYVDGINAFVAAAEQYEDQYQRFADQSKSTQDRIQAAQGMMQYYRDTTSFNSQLIKQAEQNFQGASAAETGAEVTLKIQQSKTQEAGIGFKYESQIWVREQIIDAVFSICTALVTFAASIGAMALGDEAAGAQAGAAVAQGAEAAKTAAEVASKSSEVAQTAGTIKSISDLMGKLKGQGENIQRMFESVNKILEASRKVGEVTDVADVTLPDMSGISTQADWDAFQVAVDALLQPAVDQKIPGASEYRVELDKLAIYAKAYMTSQVAMVKAGQELANLYMQRQVSANMEARLQQYASQLSQDVLEDDLAAQAFFERELDMKRWLFVAIQNYMSAYKYWALRDSQLRPSILKPVSDLMADLATIQRDYASALESFNPPPQPFNITLTITGDSLRPLDQVLTDLRTRRAATFAVELAHPSFQRMGRVRLTTTRAWLIGVAASEAAPITVDITNSGVYADRLNSSVYQFATGPLKRAFKYKGAPGDQAGIIVDGEVSTEEEALYFKPTPFTQWTIALDQEVSADVDISTLSALRLEFRGSCNWIMPG